MLKFNGGAFPSRRAKKPSRRGSTALGRAFGARASRPRDCHISRGRVALIKHSRERAFAPDFLASNCCAPAPVVAASAVSRRHKYVLPELSSAAQAEAAASKPGCRRMKWRPGFSCHAPQGSRRISEQSRIEPAPHRERQPRFRKLDREPALCAFKMAPLSQSLPADSNGRGAETMAINLYWILTAAVFAFVSWLLVVF